MSKQINDGGPAFPVIPPLDHQGLPSDEYPDESAGMTLRDYFAAKAMQGLLAGFPKGHDIVFDTVAKFSYSMADAMLEVREYATS
jgi:hypothetical protein